jgi:Cft2 family RNA processing exonuclease
LIQEAIKLESLKQTGRHLGPGVEKEDCRVTILPVLVRDGFHSKISCSEVIYELCRILLPDSGRLLEEEATHANRKGYSKHAPALPLYTEADAVRRRVASSH